MNNSINSLAKQIEKCHRKHMTWRQIGAQYGITCGLAYRIATQGYDPKSPVIRVRLGLPAMVEVSACSKCGGVHVKSRCDVGIQPRREYLDIEGLI